MTFIRNGLDMDAPETWPEHYQRAHRAVQIATSSRICCINRMVNDPPTQPQQHCRVCGRALPWYDPENPERGFFGPDDEPEQMTSDE